jgi:hypothetical protein
MSDHCDFADVIEDTVKNYQIQSIINNRSTLPRIGKCHWCEESTESNQVFCDSDCAHDYERYHAR